MDARAFRMSLPTVFEVDHPDLLDVKDARLSEASAEPLGRRILVGADLTGQWADQLARSGFQAQTPTVFLAEGLLGYLEEHEVHRRAVKSRLTDLVAERCTSPSALE